MATEFGTGKTVFILAIVIGCFAILWPKIFYPMLQSSVTPTPTIIPTTDCCDVIFEKDLNAIKIMTQLCERILSSQTDFDKRHLLSFQEGKLTKAIVNKCNAEVHDKCNMDIAEFLMDRVRLGKSYQQMLSELRSWNSSSCLKTNFGISPGLLGAPRRMRVWETKTLRQERPPHLRPHMMHPALREKGRAIPHSHIVPRVTEPETPAVPMPMPGMRPPMGGPGHVVPPPKGSNTMGIIMPLYTIGIVIFFMYTMMKLLFKKSVDSSAALKDFQPDPEFRRVVFSSAEYSKSKSQNQEVHKEETNTKLVVSAISGLVAEVNRDILSQQESTDAQAEDEPVETAVETEKEVKIEEEVIKKKVDEILEEAVEKAKAIEKAEEVEKTEEPVEVKSGGGGSVHVVGMEMTESLEGGQKWSRPPTPVTPRCMTPTILQPEPQNIYLEGSVPSQTQLLVSQSEIEKLSQGSDESPVILSGKVTLSLIGLDDALKSDGGGPQITAVSSEEASEEEEEAEEEEEEGIVEQVSEDEAEIVDDLRVNGDEDATTNYTTASGAGGLGDETAVDVSVMAYEDDEEEEEEDEDEGEELIEDFEIKTVPVVKSSTSSKSPEVEKEEEPEEEEEEEEVEEEEEEEEEVEVEEVGRPQSLQHQHQR